MKPIVALGRDHLPSAVFALVDLPAPSTTPANASIQKALVSMRSQSMVSAPLADVTENLSLGPESSGTLSTYYLLDRMLLGRMFTTYHKTV